MCEKELIVISLLLILGSVICVLLYRFLTKLLRRIPNRNEDFDAFLMAEPDHRTAQGEWVRPHTIHPNLEDARSSGMAG